MAKEGTLAVAAARAEDAEWGLHSAAGVSITTSPRETGLDKQVQEDKANLKEFKRTLT